MLYDSTYLNIKQSAEIMGNSAETRKTPNSLKQHALPYKIDSN